MNWLAHALLSEKTTAFRLGNLLPDFLSATELARLDAVFQAGIQCHRRIDLFTDQHPVVRRSVRRFGAAHRRLAPVLVDVFYDHFLSVDWELHSLQSLEEFIGEIYQAIDTHHAQLPESLWPALQRMRSENWLGSYRDLEGLRRTLTRMERRFRRQVDLVGGLAELERNYAELRTDFREFFPQLRAAVGTGPFNPGSLSSMPTSL